MKIDVEFLSVPLISEGIGKKNLEVDISGETVQDVIDELIRRFGEKVRDTLYDQEGNYNLMVQIAHNKKSVIPFNELHTPLKEGDNLTFMMLVTGG
jgi:MoaD family protein